MILFLESSTQYSEGNFGETCADIGCDVITDLDDCRTAINSTGGTISSEWVIPGPDYIYGCSLKTTNTLHFNTNPDGVARISEKPYCACDGK